jgi:hypothetical protein
MRPPAVKACAVCGRELEVECFQLSLWRFSWSDGRSTWCDDCRAEAFRIRQRGGGGGLRELKAQVRTAVLEARRA